MKRFFTLFLTTILTLAPISASAINVTIDGKPLIMDATPASINGRTMLPMRSIFESLGASVAWNNTTKGITATRGSQTIDLYLNKTTAYINGIAYTMDTAPVSLGGRTMVPARFIAEAIGCSVGWNNDLKTVVISTNGQSVVRPANTYQVLRVVDGDTFVIDFNGTEEKVRLIGVDTPESVHPDSSKNTATGTTASQYTKSLLEGENVQLEFDVQQRDKYGRLLAYAYVNGYMLNKKLLHDGYAVMATYPPNVKYVDDFKAIAGATYRSNYTAPTPTKNNTPTTANLNEATYIGNANTKKFHYPNCASVKKMSEKNKVAIPDREYAISYGYSPCGNCHP